MSPERDLRARIAVALPPLDAHARERAAAADWELRLLDAEDPDERSVLIRLAHPDLDDAIQDGRDELIVGGTPMNPRLHLAIHEVVAAQIIDDDPPEAFTTVQRLLELGRDLHEIQHMLGSAVSQQLWAATQDRRPHAREEHLLALAALPGAWDRQFAAGDGRRPGRAHGHRAHGRPRR